MVSVRYCVMWLTGHRLTGMSFYVYFSGFSAGSKMSSWACREMVSLAREE